MHNLTEFKFLVFWNVMGSFNHCFIVMIMIDPTKLSMWCPPLFVSHATKVSMSPVAPLFVSNATKLSMSPLVSPCLW